MLGKRPNVTCIPVIVLTVSGVFQVDLIDVEDRAQVYGEGFSHKVVGSQVIIGPIWVIGKVFSVAFIFKDILSLESFSQGIRLIHNDSGPNLPQIEQSRARPQTAGFTNIEQLTQAAFIVPFTQGPKVGVGAVLTLGVAVH